MGFFINYFVLFFVGTILSFVSSENGQLSGIDKNAFRMSFGKRSSFNDDEQQLFDKKLKAVCFN
ncbi:unnamed protein product [Meloidogyne enterolobii]|uniref:Uncharacterized protein n=1 Tax=Meloidogyne enterolobii TaxID=390850 RepID=A0ACB0XLE4_MELEN